MAKIFISAPDFYGIDSAIKESFEQLGYDTVLSNYRTKQNLLERISTKIGLKSPSLKFIVNPVLKYYLNEENKKFIETVKKEEPSLIFIIKGDHLFPDTLKELKRQNKCPIIAYIWDDPFYSYAGSFTDDLRKSNFEQGMDLYDYIFVYDTFYVEQIKKRGILNVKYLPLAADLKGFKNVAISEEEQNKYNYDICFVGAPYPNRIKILESLKHYSLGVYGDGWSKYFLSIGKTTPSYYKGKAMGDKVLKIYLSSKIVLNIHDPEAREGLNTRTFDILASGAAEMVDWKKNLEMHFKIGKEIVTFKDNIDLLSSVEYYLKNHDLLREISNNGRRRVRDEHTWIHRANCIINTIKEHGIISKDFGLVK